MNPRSNRKIGSIIKNILAEYPREPINATVLVPNLSLYLPHKGDIKNQAKAETPKTRETSTSFNPCSLAKIGIEVKTNDWPRPIVNIVKKIHR